MREVAEDQAQGDAHKRTAQPGLPPEKRHGQQQWDAIEHVVDLQEQRGGPVELSGIDPAAESQIDRKGLDQNRGDNGPQDNGRSARAQHRHSDIIAGFRISWTPRGLPGTGGDWTGRASTP